MKEILILVLIFTVLISALIYSIKSAMETSKKDWNTLRELQEKAYKISTKTELVEFHEEFVEKSHKINNKLIYPELHELHGYIAALYKTLK